jgi:hypothetical protein
MQPSNSRKDVKHNKATTQHHQRPKTNHGKPFPLGSFHDKSSHMPHLDRTKTNPHHHHQAHKHQSNKHQFHTRGPRIGYTHYNAGFAHTIVANAFRLINNMSAATTEVDGIPAVNFKSTNNDCRRPIFSSVDHNVFVDSIFRRLKEYDPFGMDYDLGQAKDQTTNERNQKAEKWTNLVNQFERANLYEGKSDMLMLIPYGVLNLWSGDDEGAQTEEEWSKSKIQYHTAPTKKEGVPMQPLRPNTGPGHKLEEDQYSNVLSAEIGAVAEVYVDVLKLMMRCEEASYQISLHDGIVVCTTYVVNQISKLQAVKKGQTFKSRLEKIFGKDSKMMQKALTIDTDIDNEKTLKGWYVCESLKTTTDGVQNAKTPTKDQLQDNAQKLMEHGVYDAKVDFNYYNKRLQVSRWQWQVDHFQDAVGVHDTHLHNVAEMVMSECFPVMANGMHHVSKFINIEPWNLIHKYSELFHHYMTITNELAKLWSEAEQDYAENCAKSRSLLMDLEQQLRTHQHYAVTLDYWENETKSNGKSEWFPKADDVEGPPASWADKNFCKAMVHVHNNEQMFMDRHIAQIWHDLMHTPYKNDKKWNHSLDKRGKHGKGHDHAKGGTGGAHGKTHVSVTLSKQPYNNGTIMAMMRSIQPKYTEIKLPNANIYNRRTTPATSSIMESEGDDDKPGTEMAEVQARFSDLIF